MHDGLNDLDRPLVDCAKREQLATLAQAKAAEYHAHEQRKGAFGLPYITHLQRVNVILATVLPLDSDCPIRGDDPLLRAGGWLHDTLEIKDRPIHPETLLRTFDEPLLLDLCEELTNPPEIEHLEEKHLWQVEAFRHASPRAKLIKIADQLANMISTIEDPPTTWPLEKQRAYHEKARAVASSCAGVSPLLDTVFTLFYTQAGEILNQRTESMSAPASARDRSTLRDLIQLESDASLRQLARDAMLQIIDCVELPK